VVGVILVGVDCSLCHATCPKALPFIEADLETSIHSFDFHRVASYVKSPTTIAAISGYLTD
jgi:hypothetical protein